MLGFLAEHRIQWRPASPPLCLGPVFLSTKFHPFWNGASLPGSLTLLLWWWGTLCLAFMPTTNWLQPSMCMAPGAIHMLYSMSTVPNTLLGPYRLGPQESKDRRHVGWAKCGETTKIGGKGKWPRFISLVCQVRFLRSWKVRRGFTNQ